MKPKSADDTGKGDFTQMLAELMGGDGSPQAILNALQTAQARLTQDRDSKLPDDSALALDPQLLLLAAGAMKIANAISGQTPADAGRAIADALRGTQCSLIDTILTGNATPTDSSAALLAADGDSKSGTHESVRDDKAADVAFNMLAQAAKERTGDVREAPQIRSHVGTPAWADELAGKLTVMIGRGVHSASLQLSPEQLGPLEIRISVQNDQTSVWFGAAHAETRTALEQALPRLRELLAGQGLNLSDAGVSHQAPRERGKSYAESSESPREEREFSIAGVAARGIVDAYA